MQAQQAIAHPRMPFSTVVAAVATLIAAALALALIFTVERPAMVPTPTIVTLHGVGAQQIAHNRSEEGLGVSGAFASEQIAHNRSEEGFANP
jgi:hypothetical protein